MVLRLTISTVFVATMVMAMPAAAQDSRAAELAAQQADKATKLRPNTESGAEQALEWFEGHITDPSTLYGRFGDFTRRPDSPQAWGIDTLPAMPG